MNTHSPAEAMAAETLSVNYGHVYALDNVSITLTHGRIRALIGTNGSGKSTLFKALMGLEKPSSGTIRSAHSEPGAIAYVPQSEAVDWNFPLNVRDVVSSGRRAGKHGQFFRRLDSSDKRIVSTALERTELTEFQHRQIGQLSGGQKKRAFIARGLAQQARVMLLDEPFAGVDTENQTQITALLRDLAAHGTALLVSTHDLDRLGELADDVTLLGRRVIAEGSVDEVSRPENLRAAFGGGLEASAR